MPFHFTCEHCAAPFSRDSIGNKGNPWRFCSVACMGAAYRATPDTFWNNVDRSGGPDACWPWLRYRNPKGYGTLKFRTRHYRAHRVAFFLTYGRWPEPLALHSCDNPACCNPAHLFEGTVKDNTDDMVAKGRGRWKQHP